MRRESGRRMREDLCAWCVPDDAERRLACAKVEINYVICPDCLARALSDLRGRDLGPTSRAKAESDVRGPGVAPRPRSRAVLAGDAARELAVPA